MDGIIREIYTETIYRNGSVELIYEDNHVLGVIKPQGILSQSDDSGDGDLLTEIKKDLAVRKNKPGEAFVGLVHRLDRNTGGTMVFAKTSKGASRLSQELREGRFYKCYFALAEGSVKAREGRILCDKLEKNPETNTVRKSGNGKDCRLFIRTLAERNGYSLVAAVPITGRTHQIRAQLSLLGHPLAGDVKYGGKAERFPDGEDFLGLWSGVVAVRHPVREARLVLESIPVRQGKWMIFSEEEYRGALAGMLEDALSKK